MNLLPLVLYAAAGVAYAIHFARRQPAVGRTATTLLLLAALVAHLRHRHADDGGAARAVREPVARDLDVRLAADAVVPLSRADHRRAGDGRLHPADRRRAADDSGALSRASRTPIRCSTARGSGCTSPSLLFAYASFALAGVLGLTYMLQFKEIKKKHLGYFYTRLPSLQILDVMNSRAVDDRLAVPDDRRRRRRRLDGAGARARAGQLRTCRRCR